MSAIAEDIRQKIMLILKDEETKTDLENLAVLSRVGMKVASATSAELDADATSASSTALIDLGLRLSEATDHGALSEIMLHNISGYSLLMAVNDEYIVFAGLGLKAIYRVGYYLGYLRELARKLNKLISGDKETEMALSLEESELEKLRPQKKEEAVDERPKKPSVAQDKAALDGLLGFLDTWEKEGEDLEDFGDLESDNIVSIPKSMQIGIPKEKEPVEVKTKASKKENAEVKTKASKKEIAEVKTKASKKEPAEVKAKVSTPEIEQQEETEAPAAISAGKQPEFKVYSDEVAPMPLDDYTPMEIEETPQAAAPTAASTAVPQVEEVEEVEKASLEPTISKKAITRKDYIYDPDKEAATEELPPLDELPSFEDLKAPDFEKSDSAAEYDTEFVLEKESESLDSVLKELGWEEEKKKKKK